MLFFSNLIYVLSVLTPASHTVSVDPLIVSTVPNCTAFVCGYRRCTGFRGRTGTKVEFAANKGHSYQQLHGLSYTG